MLTAISWGKGEIFGAKGRELILAMATDEISALNDTILSNDLMDKDKIY